MSATTAFDVVIQGGDDNTRTIAAVILERAFERDGFVNVETHVQIRESHKRQTLLDIMREEGPHLFERHATVQELTALPGVREYYTRNKEREQDPYRDDESFDSQEEAIEE